MRNTIDCRYRQQRGVALLFALGILSLILVSGLAFLGNALISQKLSHNNLELASAKFLGRSAVDRALSHLMMFNLLQAKYENKMVSDASSVFSFIKNSSDGIGNERIKELLSVAGYDASTSKAKWIYVHANGKESNGKGETPSGAELNPKEPIIGRYAYQVLPETSTSRLSLYALTIGSRRMAGTLTFKDGITEKQATKNSLHRIPQKYRWGVDVDELMIPVAGSSEADKGKKILSEIFEFWGADAVQNEIASEHELENLISMLSGNKAPNPFYSLTRSEDKTEAAEKLRLSVSNRKAWLKNIFVEGKGRVAREAFSAGDGKNDWYPRFNLGPYSSGEGVWYSRFLYNTESDVKVLRNKEEAILRLAGKDDQRYKDGNIHDSTYKSPIGLPFLRRIGSRSQMGAFPNVGHLRKQIAANLNDYCDEDSIPTSDQPASEWKNKLNDTTDLPSYTGNEATPYINEIGLGFRLQETKFINGTEEYNFQAKLSAEVIAELIRVYKTIVPDISTVQLHGRVKNLAVTFRVSVQGTASGTFTKDDGNPGKVEGLVLTYGDTATEAESAKFEGQDFTVKFDTGVINSGPYWVKNATIGVNSTVDVKVNLYEKLKKLAQTKDSGALGKSVSFNVVPEKVKVEITKVSFNLGNLVLTAKKVDKPETDAEIGIDFVKFLPVLGATESFSIKVADAVIENNDLSKIGVFQVPLMQTYDPRQNLIARFVNVNSDWYFFNERKSALFKDDSENWEWENLSTRVVAGGKDLDNFSNPKDPKWADGTEIKPKDTEETTDPAWQGDDKKEHISTAVIRNAPMRSPWELGFIHRGIPFQTINLKKAGGIDDTGTFPADKPFELSKFNDWGDEAGAHVNSSQGTRYENGDGGILEQVKMTELGKAYGKLDLSTLRKNSESWWKNEGTEGLTLDGLNKALFRALFEGIRRQTPAQFLEESKSVDKVPAKVDTDPAWKGTLLTSNPVDDSNFNFTSSILDSAFRTNSFINGMNALLTGGENDAAQEELIGKTINLVEGRSNSVPNTFKIIVVAQTIRDMDGPVTKLDDENNPQSKSGGAKHGVFDADINNSDREKSIHYDDILSETRMLVTVERVNYMEGDYPRARLRVKQIEYLD